MSNVTNVDFMNKRVRHFKEEPKVSREAVSEAIDMINSFIKEDYKAKLEEASAAEQVILHEIEGSDEQVLIDNAVDILLNVRDIRNAKREAKECQVVKQQIEKKLTKTNVNNLHQALVACPKDSGSSQKYFDGKVKRSSASKEYLEKALIKNMIGGK